VLGADINISATQYLTLTPSYYYYGFAKTANAVGHGHNVILLSSTLEDLKSVIASSECSVKHKSSGSTEAVLRFNMQ